MTIHVTPIPGKASFAEPSFTLGTSNAAGSATTTVASNSTILVYDTSAPTSEGIADSAATGSSGTAARRDHKHGNLLSYTINRLYGH